MDLIAVGKRIKEIRMEMNLTQFDLGSALSEGDRPISTSTIESYETGFTAMNLRRMYKFAEISGKSIDFIIKGTVTGVGMEIEDKLTTQHFLEHCEELGFVAEDHANTISIYVPGGEKSVKYLIAWVNKKESNNYRLLSILHPHKELLNDAIYIYSKTPKGQRGNKHKRLDTRQRDFYYNIK